MEIFGIVIFWLALLLSVFTAEIIAEASPRFMLPRRQSPFTHEFRDSTFGST